MSSAWRPPADRSRQDRTGIHEVKHDGYRMLVIRENDRVRLITKGGYDWTARYPWIAEAALKNRQKHFVIDGEGVVLGVDGISDFNALHSRKHDHEVQLYAFDILALGGDDLRSLPLHMRKANLEQLLAAGRTGAPSRRSSAARSAPSYSAPPAAWVWRALSQSTESDRIRPVARSTGSRCYGAADGEGCGTLGALSNDTNGAPHVATF
jgi:ATP-dependent DNA ligase